MRKEDRLAGGLLVAALLLAALGLASPGADPDRTAVLVERLPDNDVHGAWGVQTAEAALQLRPWHHGYGHARAALREVGRARRTAVVRW